MSKWTIWKWKCHYGYRDGCRPVWMVSPPGDDDWISLEFDTWASALAWVNRQLRD